MWQKLVKGHYQLGRTLIVDDVLCDALLSNKKIFGRLNTTYRRRIYLFTTKVSGRGFYARRRRPSYKIYKYYSNPCLGENLPGTIAHKVKKMRYLSQFLAFLAAWRAGQ